MLDVSAHLLTTHLLSNLHYNENLTMTDIRTFDPNSVGQKTENIFGLPFTADEASIVVIPVQPLLAIVSVPAVLFCTT